MIKISYYAYEADKNFLAHYGVKGMRWHNHIYANREERKVRRQAKKDAKEYARSKMFYGEGSRIRQRHINAIVNQRSKSPVYKKHFEQSLSKQDMAKHTRKAIGERKRKDATASAKKTTRGVIHVLSRDGARVSSAALAIGTSALAMHQLGIDKVLFNKGSMLIKNISRKFVK